jgi:two-component sensor histidine kinase
LLSNYKNWFEADTLQGAYKAAIRHLLKYNEINDSIFAQKKIKDIKQLQIQFDTKKKEDQITLLNQQAIIEKGALQQTNLERNITIGVIVIVLLFTGLLYRQYRVKLKTNRLLQSLITEKEWLLKEVHHRVKNNLHTVICLLESQAAYLENDALKAIENSQHRIYAMSLIHQKLYQSDDIKIIDIKEYLSEFVHYLRESFGYPENVRIDLKVEELFLSAGQAIPVGLIVNEALNNSFKYAFPEENLGVITIELNKYAGQIALNIKDNGIGFTFAHAGESKTLGIELMKGLARDLKGNIKFENEGGTKISLIFKLDAIEAEQYVA